LAAPAADRVHAGLMLASAAGTLAYWLVYFTSGATQVRQDAVYLGFENAFPLADGWMALGYLLSGLGLLRQRPAAVFWGLTAGSAMIFLACMDFSFDLQQGLFHAGMNGEMWVETLIVVGCSGFSSFTLWRLWQHPLRRG
jgi:hypothetical protein